MPTCPGRLRDYYDPASDYGGSTFVEALPVAPTDIVPADLFAVTTLGFDAVPPSAARRLIDFGAAHGEIASLLGSSHLAPDLDLPYADDDTLTALAELHAAVARAVPGMQGRCVAALCARKRPRLFPVGGQRVMRLVADVDADIRIQLEIYRTLARSHEITIVLEQQAEEARRRFGTRLDAYPLRWLDALLWMESRVRQPVAEPVTPGSSDGCQ